MPHNFVFWTIVKELREKNVEILVTDAITLKKIHEFKNDSLLLQLTYIFSNYPICIRTISGNKLTI